MLAEGGQRAFCGGEIALAKSEVKPVVGEIGGSRWLAREERVDRVMQRPRVRLPIQVGLGA